MSRLSNASISESAVGVPLPCSPDWQQVIRAEMWASTDRQYQQQLRELLGPLSTSERMMELCRFVLVEILMWSCVVMGGTVTGAIMGTFYTIYLLVIAIPVTVLMFMFLAKWAAVAVILGLVGMSLILGIDYGKKILSTLQDYRARCRRETAWRKRAFFMDPLPDATLAGIEAACAAHPERSAAFRPVMAEIAANQDESSALVRELDAADWRRRFVTRQVLFARGAAAIRDLETASRSSSESHRATVKALIRAIALASQRQMARLKHRHLCPEHLMRCRRYRLNLGDGSMVTYCGCRHDGCRASVGAYSCPGGAVLVLDREWKETVVHDGNRLLINAAAFREMCDVERVEIRSASDSDVRSLLIRLANDTDTRRWSWFSPLRCYLSARCTLSEQTRRALADRFGRIHLISN